MTSAPNNTPFDRALSDEDEAERIAAAEQIAVAETAWRSQDYAMIEGIIFRERPVGIRQFLTDPHYCGRHEIFPNILKLAELAEHPLVRHSHENLGKGSGKTFRISRALCYGVYQLLCYRNPHDLFGLADTTTLLVVNFSTGKLQSRQAIFAETVGAIKSSPWFAGKFHAKQDCIEFENHIKIICGHSAGKTFEGHALWRVCLDESNLHYDRSGRSNAEDLFNVGKEGGFSRFPGAYKVFTISRSVVEGDFESRQQNAIASAGIKLPPDFLERGELPDLKRVREIKNERGVVAPESMYEGSGEQGWTADMFPLEAWWDGESLAVRGAAWDFNPKTPFSSFAPQFASRPYRVACVYGSRPISGGVERLIKNHRIVRANVDEDMRHPFLDAGELADWFRPRHYSYHVHFDLSKNRDCTGFALAHAEPENAAIVIDAMLEIVPPKGGDIRISRLRRILYDLRQRGFDIDTVSFDGFGSLETMQELEARAFNVKLVSVDRSTQAYDTLIELLYDRRLRYYHYQPFEDCLRNLVLLGGGQKVDHDPAVPGSKKDVSDAVAAVVHRCMSDVGSVPGIAVLR